MVKYLWQNTKWMQILLHVAAWLIVFSLPYLLISNFDPNRPKAPDSRSFFYLGTLTGLFWIVTFYFNAFILTPKFIYERKFIQYVFILLVLFAAIMMMHRFIFLWLISSRPFIIINSVLFNLGPFLLAVAVSTTYQFIRDKAKADKLAQQKQEENLKTELSFLRSQISPHFVLNVLNNIVALVRLKSDQLEPTIMKLSSLMQYMLYETDEEKVLLKSEVEYLQSYIDLQQQRFGNKLKVNVSLQYNEDEWNEIEPMLLIPFVENAFKHGIGLIQEPQIDIQLSIKNNVLHFCVCNKYNEDSNEIRDKTSGIGLANVQRRLNLLYGNRHQLKIKKDDGWFKVNLQLNLH